MEYGLDDYFNLTLDENMSGSGTQSGFESYLWDELGGDLRTDDGEGVAPMYLNQVDYTLNSPLITDGLDSFLRFCTQSRVEKMYYNKTWDDKKIGLEKMNVNLDNIRDPRLLHQTMGLIFQKKYSRQDVRGIKGLLELTDIHAEKTFEVVRAYIKGWTGEDAVYLNCDPEKDETLKYGQIMLDSLVIVWIMNAKTNYELDALRKKVKFFPVTGGNPKQGTLFVTPSFGEVIIFDGLVYLREYNILLDRNMFLMVKDTATARFQTLLSIDYRYSKDYSPDHYRKIVEVYNYGDKGLIHDTNSAYEAFAIIEAVSSLKLSQLASECRPAIPPFMEFQDYLSGRIDELSRLNPELRSFFSSIQEVRDVKILLTIYGIFRHWGHPFIDYLEGLDALYKNVTSEVNVIDKEYAAILASDLAFKVLKKEFRAKGKWFVDKTRIEEKNPLYPHIMNNTWPSLNVVLDYPGTWHLLPLDKCWDVPEVVDPSLIYSDKTHSITKKELVRHLLTKPLERIPTKKVLETLLREPSTNWPEFLRQVNDRGIDDDSLIIGLKAKERELKRKGRFFALMSWELRQYFVFTEYLIKSNVIPLFKGLTMADDQTTLIKKLLYNSTGQGSKDYENITIANHIDYEKWNNFQRYDSTEPVFTVMGKFFGYPSLFSRTHEFFEKSLIYYKDRGDLMRVSDGKIVNKDPNKRVCWQGQKGGLEGLRQKGWSVLNLLLIEREAKIRNTQVKILAQGDNQVICTQYRLVNSGFPGQLEKNISGVIRNNAVIMKSIREGTKKIGLIINENETLQATDLLVYGKVILYRGNITSLDEKRYSRITCTTNDQLPNLSNTLATVATNCLTVAHYSASPMNPIHYYNFMGNFVISLLFFHNPALRKSVPRLIDLTNPTVEILYRMLLLFLDPSLGGTSGMSLTRFHMRLFPDPVTEGLSFWKIVHHHTTSDLVKKLSISAGNPPVMKFKSQHFSKLLEDPTSLNLPHSISAQNLLKEEIKKNLINTYYKINNDVIRDSVLYLKRNELRFNIFLRDIQPCFPKFLSELRSATFFGIVVGVVGLFENSRTIRNLFKQKFTNLVDLAILRCESDALKGLMNRVHITEGNIWNCSSSQADKLREKSWGRKIIGTTIPHPAELINQVAIKTIKCDPCVSEHPNNIHTIVIIPEGFAEDLGHRGKYHPYLGSKTSESTSLIQPWEKSTDITFIRKASQIRRALHWFVDPNGNLAKTLQNNLLSLTGEDPGGALSGFKRTGSALHRFSCSRISAGGFIANSPLFGTYMIVSTDNFQLLGDTNYDFMYQSLILYSQQTAGELHKGKTEALTYHFHISCNSCLREIEEPTLEARSVYNFEDVSDKLNKWKPSNVDWFEESIPMLLKVGQWDRLSLGEVSYQVGLVHGVIYGYYYSVYNQSGIISGLFPVGIRNKLLGTSYLLGLKDGLFRSAILNAIHRRIFYHINDISFVIYACYLGILDNLSNDVNFLAFVQGVSISKALNQSPHKIPSSYPINLRELGSMVKTYMKTETFITWFNNHKNDLPLVWIFADFASLQLAGVLILAYEALKICSIEDKKLKLNQFKALSDLLSSVQSKEYKGELSQLTKSPDRICLCDQELRHAVKFSLKEVDEEDSSETQLTFEDRQLGYIRAMIISYSSKREECEIRDPPRRQNPLISGLRVPQIATGSFLKVRDILVELGLKPKDILCGGDGSGGISALLLRLYSQSRLIFNSLFDSSSEEFSGTLPSAPSAIDNMPISIKQRCVNLNSVWEHPSDLSKRETWVSFCKIKDYHKMNISLIVLDMEVKDDKMMDAIEKCLRDHLSKLCTRLCTVIFKTYLYRLKREQNILTEVGEMFSEVYLFQTQLSSSHTSEIYVVMQNLKSGTTISTFPNYTDILDELEKFYCFRTYQEEFNRALEVSKIDTTIGIPPCLLPDPINELQEIFRMIGGNSVRVIEYFNLRYQVKDDWSGFLIGALVLVFNEQINTTRKSFDPSLDIPSDPVLSDIFALLAGVMLYVSITVEDCKLGEYIQSLIDEPFVIQFFLEVSKNPFKKMFPPYSTGWKINGETKRETRKKDVYLQHKMALIGAVIRYSHAAKMSSTQINIDKWIGILQQINRGFTKRHLIESTDILYPIHKPHV